MAQQHNVHAKFDLCIYGLPRVYVLETHLGSYDEQIDGFKAAMKEVVESIEGTDASAVLTEVSLRGVGMYIGKNLRKAMTKYGVESGAIEIDPAPESFIYNVQSSSH